MFSDEDLNIILTYLSKVSGKTLRSIDDLLAQGTDNFLDLTEKLPDDVLPIFISMFKSSLRGREFFHKLTGDLDEQAGKKAALPTLGSPCRGRRTPCEYFARRDTKAFLKRYMDLILEQEDANMYFNPLLVYLAPECFDDLAFIQSRQSFFLRQTVDTINEFLHSACRCPILFGPGRQEDAWKWFWNYLLKK